MNSNEAAAVLQVSRVAFRKRLERSRTEIVEFMKTRCGLANPENPCRCRRKVTRAIELKRIDRESLLFAHDPKNANGFPKVLVNIRKLEETQRAVALATRVVLRRIAKVKDAELALTNSKRVDLRQQVGGEIRKNSKKILGLPGRLLKPLDEPAACLYHLKRHWMLPQ